jgi:hypothetical protein
MRVSVNVRPETLALQERIAAAVRTAEHCAPRGLTSVLLLACSDSTTDAIIQDPMLTPVEKIVWLAMELVARVQGAASVLPSQVELARIANVSDPDTVGRALLNLRCARWLTACHASWCQNGRQRHEAFVLHASPLPIPDTLYLDPHYPVVLEHAVGQRYGRVQTVARRAMRQLARGTAELV